MQRYINLKHYENYITKFNINRIWIYYCFAVLNLFIYDPKINVCNDYLT